jgi:hypothetical protein
VFTDVGPNRISILYRSVSPWEMADILNTQSIRGRCGKFASDDRCSPDCHVWFGDAIRPIIHSGEDYIRYTQTISLWDPILAALDQLYTITSDIQSKLRALEEIARSGGWYSREQRMQQEQLNRTYTPVRALEQKLSDAYRKAIYGLANQARASAAKLPVTSYVIVLQDMPGGTMYSDRDSRQGKAIEACFPLSAAQALYEHIAGVELVKYREGGGYDTVGHVFVDELDHLKVRLPRVRKATADAALNTFERLRPKLREWIDV